MSENQNIEYKSVWKDEYLRWICGFANAQGGTLFIGKDDNGNVVSVNNATKLLTDLPNKITDILGIVADVNLHETEQGDYLEIIVDPQPNPVNYKGEYHFRSGSTKQELKGAALDKFLLQKFGKKWDGVPIPNIGANDLKQETFDFFRIGYIEAWGRGIRKMNEQCVKAGLPLPLYYFESSGFWVEFRKDIYYPEYLKDLGLNDRQIKAVLYVKEKGKITNKEYKEINQVSNRTATYELKELIENFNVLKMSGASVGTYYEFS